MDNKLKNLIKISSNKNNKEKVNIELIELTNNFEKFKNEYSKELEKIKKDQEEIKAQVKNIVEIIESLLIIKK